MVHRDPETGQFVSRSMEFVEQSEAKTLVASLSSVIPAADLGGGTGTSAFTDADATEFVDFTPFLENDEVFEAVAMQYEASLYLPTTATAEGSGGFAFAIRDEPRLGAINNGDSSFYDGGPDFEDGDADIRVRSVERTGTLAVGSMYGENSINDTGSSVALGADYENTNELISFMDSHGYMPAFDRDDELYLPHQISFDNISDHAIGGTVVAALHGRVTELD